ncbi:hypothetical protein JCM10207_008004 [Rhodosporidiobolus poonsookiae]
MPRSLFRPCIDLHDGKVRQVVGSTLDTAQLKTNFVSEKADLERYYCRKSGLFRKAALKIVQDIGEPALSESAAQTVQPTAAASSDSSSDSPSPSSVGSEASTPSSVEKQDGDSVPASSASSSSSTAPDSSPASVTDEERKTTTSVRQPLEVPSDVHVRISADNLLDYVGPPLYQKDRLYNQRDPVGVSTGLGYLGNGSGAVMPIEVTSMPGSGIQLTGKLGDVIKESAQIALAFLRAHAFELGLTEDQDKDLLEKRAIHLHMPEAAVGKDGPSAGIALLTALVSHFSRQGVRSDLAMTGEITLTGQVTPVGGLKEKLTGAHRAGIKTILVPAGCKADIEHNIPATVKDGLEIRYVNHVVEVLEIAFEGRDVAKKAGQTAH